MVGVRMRDGTGLKLGIRMYTGLGLGNKTGTGVEIRLHYPKS